ncbi:hypothetical protein QAD02_022267 [Eretmocerus hayati]|uniref:Uncharacterized protein n=1 Tax=Eretmocerus hayati TaxID=131215 RepID=A0ACC2PU29_9HYME|nr:hypothetical protein QAD02_022267 [Eretmocerus hayati]
MEASSAQQCKEKEQRVHRPCAFDKMEGLVREMQDPENGVPVRSQKQFLTSIPSAFMGYDLIEWLMDRLNIEESEAVHIANQLCQYGYYFPVNDSRNLLIKDDSSLYRFQSPYYWPWQHRTPDNVEYAIYLAKRTLRNKQRHGLEEYELEALNSLKRNLQNKWDIIQLQAEEQIKLSKERKKGDKIVSDSQERAFWRVYRPPPGCSSSLEVVPIPTRARPGLPRAPPRKRTLNDLQREVELLRNSVTRTRIKVSAAVENLKSHFETYVEYDPMMTQPQPSNPWITDDQTFWQLNSPLVEVPTEKRVKRWGLSMEELMSDPTGLQEFTNYLRKEYSHENIRFWLAVKDLRHSHQAKIADKVTEIFREFLAPGAPCEINIDGKTMEKVHQEMKNPTRFTFDSAAEHVYTLLLKKDCYPRFIRSDFYRNLLAAGIQPLQKKRFFNFGGPGKKKVGSSTTAGLGSSTQQPQSLQSQQQQHSMMGGRRRGSDRSLSGSAHELAICGVRDTTASTSRVPHSHSQSNLTDIPYRDAGSLDTARTVDDVCPWDSASPPPVASTSSTGATARTPGAVSTASAPAVPLEARVRKNSSTQVDSCSSSSDVSLAVVQQQQQAGTSKGSVSQQQQRSFSTTTPTASSSGSRVRLADTTRASVATCSFSPVQHSFDLGYSTQTFADSTKLVTSTTRAQLYHQAASCAADIAPTVSQQQQQQQQQQQPRPVGTLAEESEVHHATRSTNKAPLISISAIVGDDADGEDDEEAEESSTTIGGGVAADDELEPTEDTSSDCALMSEPLTLAQSVAESESELLDASRDNNNVNEVCPWEDEENCRVDTTYVKTYARLGYL